MYQLDIKNAFLHGDLQEMYMLQPLGYEVQGESHEICKLKKIIFSLKQSPPVWFDKFSTIVAAMDCVRAPLVTLFVRHFFVDTIILTVYVDIIFTGDDHQCIQLKVYLSFHFHMKNLGHMRYFLGINVARSPKGLYLSQRNYDLLEEIDILGSKLIDTLMNHNIHLDQNFGETLADFI